MRFPTHVVRVPGIEWKLGGFTYGHVQNDNGGDESNTKASNDPASAHETEASGSGLEDTTNHKNKTAGNDGGPTSDEVGNVAGDESAEKSTKG